MPSGIGSVLASPIGGALIGGATSLIGGNRSSDAIGDASAAGIAEQRRQFDIATQLALPGVNRGNAAGDQLMALLGLTPSNMTFNTGGIPQGAFGDNRGLGSMVRGLVDQIREGGGLPDSMTQQYGLDTQGGSQTGGGGASANPLDIIRNTPGYNFQLEQGTRALNANRSAGGSSGGDLMKDFARFNQGVASDFYRDYANRLANLAGTGQQASSQLGSQAILTGSDIAGSMLSAGEARASGIAGTTSALSGIAGELFKYLGSR